MTIVERVMGIDAFEANLIRKGTGKRLWSTWEDNGIAFVKGGIQLGLSHRDSDRLWELLWNHMVYTFNKSHVISMTLITYWIAWLKFYYPNDFNYGE